MSFTDLFNKVYSRRKIEELEQVSHRLNALIQLTANRAGYKNYTDHQQGIERANMPPEITYDLDKAIIQKSNEIMKKLVAGISDVCSPSMQEVERMILKAFKERLQEKRGMKPCVHGTGGSIQPNWIKMEASKKVEELIEFMEPEKFEKESDEVIELKDINQTSSAIEETRLLRGGCKHDFLINDLSTAISEIQCKRKIHSELGESRIKLAAPGNFKGVKSTTEITESENVVESVGSSVTESIRMPTLMISRSDFGMQRCISYEHHVVSPIGAAKYTGFTIKEAMQLVKQNRSDREIVILVSPMPEKTLRAFSSLQITLFSKFEQRILGSFQIPDEKLSKLEEEGVFKEHPAIFLSRSISSVQLNIDVVVDQLSHLSHIQSNYEDIDCLFNLAEIYDYQIYARFDNGSEEPVYVCDFYTDTNFYVGTTRLFGVDVLEQLRKRPQILKNFEVIVELNDQILPKNVKEIVETLLANLSLTKIYERVRLIFFKFFEALG